MMKFFLIILFLTAGVEGFAQKKQYFRTSTVDVFGLEQGAYPISEKEAEGKNEFVLIHYDKNNRVSKIERSFAGEGLNNYQNQQSVKIYYYQLDSMFVFDTKMDFREANEELKNSMIANGYPFANYVYKNGKILYALQGLWKQNTSNYEENAEVDEYQIGVVYEYKSTLNFTETPINQKFKKIKTDATKSKELIFNANKSELKINYMNFQNEVSTIYQVGYFTYNGQGQELSAVNIDKTSQQISPDTKGKIIRTYDDYGWLRTESICDINNVPLAQKKWKTTQNEESGEESSVEVQDYTTTITIRDRNNLILELYHLDEKGNKTMCDEGHYIEKTTYDESANVTSKRFFNANKKPQLIQIGATTLHGYNLGYENYQVVSTSFFGVNNELIPDYFGGLLKRNVYEDGRLKEVFFLDENNKPMNDNSGVHLYKFDYSEITDEDANNSLMKSKCYDKNGIFLGSQNANPKNADDPEGNNYERIVYSNEGMREEYSYFNLAMKPLKSELDPTRIVQIKNTNAQIISKAFFGFDGLPKEFDGVQKIAVKYDTVKNLVSISTNYYNTKAELTDPSMDASTKIEEYIVNDPRIFSIRKYNAKGEPVKIDAFHKTQFEETDSTRTTSFFDEKNKPVIGYDGAHKISSFTRLSDDSFHLFEKITYYDKKGKLLNNAYGFAKSEISSTVGVSDEETYTDKKGKLVLNTNRGYAKLTSTFDTQTRTTTTYFWDQNMKPIDAISPGFNFFDENYNYHKCVSVSRQIEDSDETILDIYLYDKAGKLIAEKIGI